MQPTYARPRKAVASCLDLDYEYPNPMEFAMQTVKQCVADVRYVMGVSHSRVNGIARALIDAGLLPKSSGRDIRKMDGVQLAGLVAAVAMAEKVEDAPKVAEEIMCLRLNGEDGETTFKAAFAASITTGEEDAAPSIIFGKTRNGFTATIEGKFIHNGDLSEGVLPFYQNASWGGWTRTSVTLAPEGFVILRNLFRYVYVAAGNPIYGTIDADAVEE